MAPNKLFPLIMTESLAATRAFYVERLGCSAVFDMPDYLQIRFGSADGPELCFMKPSNAPALGAEPAVFDGRGLVVSVPVDGVDGRFRELRKNDVPIVSEPTDRPWKWRSFVCRDPNGILLDFFEPLAHDAAAAAS